MASTAPSRMLLERILLACGIAAPLAYFGLQLAIAPMYPGYDWKVQVASELGSAGAPTAGVFNASVMTLGVVYLAAAVGLLLALRRARVHIVLAAIVALCLVSHGASALNAALHPLPDPQHSPGFMGLGLFALPVAAPIAFWFVTEAPMTKAALLVCLAAFALAAIAMSNPTPLESFAGGGLRQRGVAFVANAPVFIMSLVLWLRAGRGAEAKGA